MERSSPHPGNALGTAWQARAADGEPFDVRKGGVKGLGFDGAWQNNFTALFSTIFQTKKLFLTVKDGKGAMPWTKDPALDCNMSGSDLQQPGRSTGFYA